MAKSYMPTPAMAGGNIKNKNEGYCQLTNINCPFSEGLLCTGRSTEAMKSISLHKNGGKIYPPSGIYSPQGPLGLISVNMCCVHLLEES